MKWNKINNTILSPFRPSQHPGLLFTPPKNLLIVCFMSQNFLRDHEALTSRSLHWALNKLVFPWTVHYVPNIVSSHIFVLLISNTETNVINSVGAGLHDPFFFSFSSFCVRVHSGEHEPPELQRSSRPLHLPGCGAAHEPRSRAGDFRGFACFTKLLLLCGT